MAMFDGLSGMIVGRIMARMNEPAEREAVDLLAPIAGQHVLVIGFGPGIGLQYLLNTRPQVALCGIDPSAVMVKAAAKLNRSALESGRLRLVQCGIAELTPDNGPFEGALAVNAIQMCEPIDHTARQLRALLAPGARLITITHDWAMKKQAGSVANFVARLGDALTKAGFSQVESRAAIAEKGRAIIVECR